VQFENNFINKGGKVIWAQTAGGAVAEIIKILKKHDSKLVVKSKSMITEELELNKALETLEIEVVETDLGEYIVQQAGEKPYHIVTPAMHKSKEDIAKLFHEKFDLPIESTPTEITNYVRHKLRKKFVEADVGITGVNFLIAGSGSVALTENEGNGLMSVSFPKIHIAIAGIERIIPTISDLDLFWPLLATHGTGQHMTVYNSIISGPRQTGEIDGPKEMYIILLDNGRTEILRHRLQRRALSCIRCGACLNVCPVYKSIGGYTYNSTYTGPIGSVITPHLKGMKDYHHLSFASSLCGRCTEVCPVNRWMMDFGGASLKNMAIKTFAKKAWGNRRTLPTMVVMFSSIAFLFQTYRIPYNYEHLIYKENQCKYSNFRQSNIDHSFQ